MKSKKIVLRFFQSPIIFEGSETLEKIILEKNQLVGEAGAQKARGTGEKESFDCGLVFRSVNKIRLVVLAVV